MARLLERLTRFFTEPLVPDAAFHLSRGYLCGVRFSRKERRTAAHVIRPLPPGTLAPSFDRPNVANGEALEAALRDAQRRLGAAEGAASLLIPETCVKTALLSFETLPASAEEREAVLRWRLAKTLPLKISDLRLSFDVVKTNGGERAFCALAVDNVVREYEQSFAKAGLRVRLIGLPTPHLLNLIPPAGPADILVANVEDDHLSLLAFCGGDLILFRVKTFVPEGGGGGGPWAQAANEMSNTIRFLEDRERKRVEAVWVRDAGAAGPAETAVLEKRVGCPVRAVSFASPAVAGPKEQALLAPLIGQVS